MHVPTVCLFVSLQHEALALYIAHFLSLWGFDVTTFVEQNQSA